MAFCNMFLIPKFTHSQAKEVQGAQAVVTSFVPFFVVVIFGLISERYKPVGNWEARV